MTSSKYNYLAKLPPPYTSTSGVMASTTEFREDADIQVITVYKLRNKDDEIKNIYFPN